MPGMHSESVAAGCFHCGKPALEPDLRRSELLGAIREFCCAGCEGVARTIANGGFGAYYETREAPRPDARGAAGNPVPLSAYDDPAAQRQFVTNVAEHGREALLILEGVTCAGCVWLIERRLREMPGVTRAHVNAGTRRALVAWDARQVSFGRIIEAVRAIGYDAFPFDPQRKPREETAGRRAALWRLFVSGFASMQVMMYALPAYLDGDATLTPDAQALMRWAGFALTLPVILFACGPFFSSAWRDLRRGRIGLDAPISLGILAGFAASTWATFSGTGEVYFDSIAMLVFLLLAARGAETSARARAERALDPLLRWMPAFALRLRTPSFAAQAEKIAAHELLPGELALVPPGERVPADALVVQGASSADESMLTGESAPVEKRPGSELVGGSVNLEQPLIVRILRAGNDTRAAAILRLIERAASSRPAVVAGADRIARVLAWVVIVAAVAVFLAWLPQGPERALWAAIAVLVVTCPCALGLAAPIALTTSTARLLARGVVLSRGHAIEVLARATDVVLDKTGTLTLGKPRLVGVSVFGELAQAECVRVAHALEATSRHPVAAAFEVADGQPPLSVSDVRHVPGRGIEALIEGRRVRVGNEAFCAELAGPRTQPFVCEVQPGRTAVHLADTSGWLAEFLLEDSLREHATEFVGKLRQAGMRVHLVSGDRDDAVAALAQRLGIADHCGCAEPQHKVAYVEKLQRAGHVVVMIGDGLNDAPVLAHANASIAMGSGAGVSQLHSDLVLLGSQLDSALDAFALARSTMRIIRQNFAWAIAYNALALPAAALGWIGPWEAAIGMAASSLVVALNSLRLARRRVPDSGPWKASPFSFPSPSRSYS